MQVNTVCTGDCLEVLDTLPNNCIDSIITDPPYSLNFMNKHWDNEIAFNPEVWRKALRIAKPGAFLMAFGGTRTYHRLACAIEDAGWEIRDCITYLNDGNQAEQAFMASLNDEQLAAYLELHYPAEQIAWVYGQGMGLGHDISKGLDKAAIVDCPNCGGSGLEAEQTKYCSEHGEAYEVDLCPICDAELEIEIEDTPCQRCGGSGKVRGAERETIGINPNGRDTISSYKYDGRKTPKPLGKNGITAPATPLAAKFSGYRSRLKPAHEPVICARKPLSYVPNCDIITETNILLGAMLCLLLSSANDVGKTLVSLPTGLKEEPVFVAVIVSLLNGERSGELSAKMDMFNSPEMVSTCLSIAKLWNSILAEILNQENRFTIKMGIEVTTALKTLNSLILPIIPENIIQDVCRVNGSLSNVTNAGETLSEEKTNIKDIPTHIVAEIATWKARESGTIANIAAENLQLLIPSINFVLSSVQQDIITNCGQIKSQLNVQDAKENSKQSLQDQQNTVVNNATSKIGKSSSVTFEPIVVAMKPIDKNYAHNAEKWGVSGLNIDGCRVPTLVEGYRTNGKTNDIYGDLSYTAGQYWEGSKLGRYPANIIHSNEPNVLAEFDKAGPKTSGKPSGTRNVNSNMFFSGGRGGKVTGIGDSGSAARYFATCPPDLPRFIYQAKASPKERGAANNHPTVKPLELLKYLARLTRPPDGGIVLDMFAGSGTTVLACIAEDRNYIVIEKEPEYVEIIKRRIAEYTGQEIAPKEIKIEGQSVRQLGLW